MREKSKCLKLQKKTQQSQDQEISAWGDNISALFFFSFQIYLFTCMYVCTTSI